MPLVKFISPTDPKWLSTLDALTASLVSDSLVYRYDPQASPDGLRGEEGTFSACSFWYVEALARAGRLEEARLAFEKMLTYANHLGLYAEQISRTGRAAGQLPPGTDPPGADQRRVQPRPRPGLTTADHGGYLAIAGAHRPSQPEPVLGDAAGDLLLPGQGLDRHVQRLEDQRARAPHRPLAAAKRPEMPRLGTEGGQNAFGRSRRHDRHSPGTSRPRHPRAGDRPTAASENGNLMFT